MKLPPSDFWSKFKDTYGAFSTPEAIALYNICLQSPTGLWYEFGSHKGKSSQVIAAAGVEKGHNTYFFIEPEFSNEDWMGDTLNAILATGVHALRVNLVSAYSLDVIPDMKDVSFVFIDSGIHDDMVMEEVKGLEDRMIEGGVIAFHDFGNQFTAVARAYDYLVSTGKYEPIHINWKEIFDYVRENNLEDGNNSWHEKGSEEFPKFVGALKRK